MKLSIASLTHLSVLALSISMLAACGKSAEDQLRSLPLGDKIFSRSSSSSAPKMPESVELISRDAQGGTYNTGLFSFFNGSRNDKLMDNYGEVQFQGYSYKSDEFNTVMVVDQVGLIKDLGETSCASLANSYEQNTPYKGPGQGGYPHREDRAKDPMFWLEYSQAWSDLQRGKDVGPTTAVNVGHCYLVVRTDNRTKIIAMFHVKSQVKTQSVVIDELEVFQRATLSK